MTVSETHTRPLWPVEMLFLYLAGNGNDLLQPYLHFKSKPFAILYSFSADSLVTLENTYK